MSGVVIDPNKASVFDLVLPLPTSKARRYNMLGDPVGTEDDVQRVIQTLTGGTYPVVKNEASTRAAYRALLESGYRPPSIDPNRGYLIGSEFRPLKDGELELYTAARSRLLRDELGQLSGPVTSQQARAAYERANSAALREIGAVSARTVAQNRASEPPASVAGTSRPSRAVGAASAGGGLDGRSRSGGLSRFRRVRLGRAGRRGRLRAVRLRQPRLGRGRRRGLRRRFVA